MSGERGRTPASLCATCAHVRRIENDRGSVFLLCERARTDPRFPKYPPQPVIACIGFERAADEPR